MPVREATPDDLPEICALITELADFEQMAAEVVADPDEMGRHLFGPAPVARAVIAEAATARPEGTATAGMALWYPTFSTFLGRPGIWLEDLYVRPAYRGRGLGRELLEHVRSQTDGRVEWSVLDWNETAIAFYQRLGARPVDGWTRYRWLAPPPS